jgi:hypothetical protein
MTTFPVHTIESAPERSRPALRQLQSAFGMVPNIAGAMTTSPVLINSLVGLFGNVHGGSFTEAQVQIVLLTDAVVTRAHGPSHSIRRWLSRRGLIRRMSKPSARVVCRRMANSPRCRLWQER